jgi:hypothetical protein
VRVQKILDFGFAAGLLSAEIVGRETDHHQAAVLVFFVERFESLVLGSEPAFAGHVDQENRLSLVRRQGRVLAIDRRQSEIVDAGSGKQCHGRKHPKFQKFRKHQWLGYTKSALLGDGLLRQLAQNGKLEFLILADLDDHEDPGPKNDGLQEQREQVRSMDAREVDSPIDN